MEQVDETSQTTVGRCLCGGVAFRVTGPLRAVLNCHCERCRRFTGQHLAATAAPTDRIDVTDEGGLLRWYDAPGCAYAFCRTCGSSLFWRAESSPGVWSICAGTLDPPTGLRTVEAWWVSQASDYFVRQGLPEREKE